MDKELYLRKYEIVFVVLELVEKIIDLIQAILEINIFM